MIHDILQIVERELGKGTPKSKGNIAFFSPFKSHRNKKLQINFSESHKYGIWHCWISDEAGLGVYSLFKRLNKSRTLLNHIKELEKPIFDKYRANYRPDIKSDFKTKTIALPDEAIYLSHLTSIDDYTIEVLNILYSRRITDIDILRHNICYCKEGDYKDRIIIPNYNELNELNYFQGRYIGDYKYTPNYIGPDVKRDSIIGFENLINFNLPVCLVEGGFDAISIRFNASPLYGKSLSDKLIYKLTKYQTPDLYLIFDEDAKERMIKVANYLSGKLLHTNIHMVFLPPEEDPNKIGFSDMWTRINNTSVLFNDEFLIKYKLQ